MIRAIPESTDPADDPGADRCDACGQAIRRSDAIVQGHGRLWHARCAPTKTIWPESRGTTSSQLHAMHLDAEESHVDP